MLSILNWGRTDIRMLLEFELCTWGSILPLKGPGPGWGVHSKGIHQSPCSGQSCDITYTFNHFLVLPPQSLFTFLLSLLPLPPSFLSLRLLHFSPSSTSLTPFFPGPLLSPPPILSSSPPPLLPSSWPSHRTWWCLSSSWFTALVVKETPPLLLSDPRLSSATSSATRRR